MECSISGCTIQPTLYCTCSTPIKYFCPSHLSPHLGVQSPKKHQVFSTVKNIPVSQKDNLKNSIISTIKQFKAFKKQIHELYKTTNEIILKSILNLDKMISFHKRLLNETITHNPEPSNCLRFPQ